VVFGVTVALLIVLSGWESRVTGVVERWSHWVAIPGLHGMDPTRLLMLVGVVLLQLVSGNQLVQLVLSSIGAVRPAGEPQPSESARWNAC
jgi:hypothetical protein